MLRLDVAVGESVDIDNGRVVVTVERKSGQLARLSFEAARNIPIRRLAPTEPQTAVRKLEPVG